MPTTTDPLNALLAVRDGYTTARWNFVDAVGSPVDAPAGMGNAVTLDYSFLTAVPAYFATSGFRAFTVAEQAATRDVLAIVSSVAGAGFSEVGGVGTLTFGMNTQGAGSAGYGYYPSFGYASTDGTITSVKAADAAGDVWLDSGEGWAAADFARGGRGHGTLLHEVLHALGLKHPFESTPTGYTLDAAHQHKGWTVMSYAQHPHGLFRTVTDHGGGSYGWSYEYIQPDTPMPYDIVALQALYGVNRAVRAGDDTYAFDPAKPFIRTIVDAGGIDTISVANFGLGCTIDLREGCFSSITIPSDPLPSGIVEHHRDIYDGTDNLAIAFGTRIEHATGGAGADRLIGNALANVLEGNAGADTLVGNAGNDTLLGGTGNDTLEGGSGNDRLEGGSGNDRLASSSGNDRLDGGTGADTMLGGAGNDTYVVDNPGDRVVETTTIGGTADAGGSDTVRASVSFTLGSFVEKLVLTGSGTINGTGNSLANSITGNGAGNRLSGGSGNDTLSGGAGSDLLIGGSGNDLLTGGPGLDSFRFHTAPSATTNRDRITDFVVADDTIQLENAVFTSLAAGTLARGLLRTGAGATRAADANDYLIYNASTGALYYDADGSAAASAPVQFATLSAGLALTVSDFFVT